MVISDIVMPDMDGFELAEIIHSKYPSIQLQFCSGFTEATDKNLNNEILTDNILRKPFTCNELLERVKSLLNN